MSMPTLHKFSVSQYHQLIERGILTKVHRVELLDGQIIDKPSTSPPRAAVRMRLSRFFYTTTLPNATYIQAGGLALTGSHPEPDFAIVRGDESRFDARYPTRDEVLLVVDAYDDARLPRLPMMLSLYAAECIPEYWIVDVADRSLTVHRNPEGEAYRDARRFTADDTVAPAAFADLTLKVASLFPG